jgi:hypothetical protein
MFACLEFTVDFIYKHFMSLNSFMGVQDSVRISADETGEAGTSYWGQGPDYVAYVSVSVVSLFVDCTN